MAHWICESISEKMPWKRSMTWANRIPFDFIISTGKFPWSTFFCHKYSKHAANNVHFALALNDSMYQTANEAPEAYQSLQLCFNLAIFFSLHETLTCKWWAIIFYDTQISSPSWKNFEDWETVSVANQWLNWNFYSKQLLT